MISWSVLLNWLFQTGVAFIATIAFAIIFHTPRKEYVFAGITGGAGWLVYLASMGFGADTVIASFFASVALAWLSRIFSFILTPENHPPEIRRFQRRSDHDG